MKYRNFFVRYSVLVLIGFVLVAGTGFVNGAGQHPALNFSDKVSNSRDLILNNQETGTKPGTATTGISQTGSGFPPATLILHTPAMDMQKAWWPVSNFTTTQAPAKPLSLPALISMSSALPVAFLDSSYRTAPVRPVSPGGAKKVIPGSDAGKNVVEANNRFAFELYSDLDKNNGNAGKNIFFSPFSISTALALVYEGARGSTADQIQAVFHFPTDNTTRRSEYSAVIDGLNGGNSGYTLSTANALWAEKTYSFLPEYTRVAQVYYGASTKNLDFINQPEQSRSTINKWVADQTNDKIKDLLPPGTIDPATRLVITNAIYFKGTWVKQFEKDQTKDARFTVAPGQSVTVSMMQRTDEDAVYNYTETTGAQVLEMPYTTKGGKSLSMLVILPKGESLGSAEASLAGSGLSDLKSKLTSQRVMVDFPKFRLETQYGLSENLQAMGMPVAFSGGADFSGMDGTRDLAISDVVHKAYIDVNEEGTEAAAATGAVMTLSMGLDSNPVPVFNADHPFIFFIMDNDTGNILFMGRVMNPNS
jgi:serpin B